MSFIGHCIAPAGENMKNTDVGLDATHLKKLLKQCKKKVLVVDDDDFVRMVIVQILQSAGYDTDECAGGAEAI